MITTAPARPRAGHDDFQHEAVFYAGDDDYLAATVPFIIEGVTGGEPVMVAVPEPRLAALYDALEADVAHRVTFADMAAMGRNPACIIPAWRDFLDRHGRGTQPVRGIGEPVWAARGPDELIECQRHESLLNVAFADSGRWRLLCPYDTIALAPAVIDEARRSHPVVTERGVRARSAECHPLVAAARLVGAPLPPSPADARALAFGPTTLATVRRFVAQLAGEAGLDADRADDLVLSVHEVAGNSVVHGGGTGVVRAWCGPERIVLEVVDTGRVVDPLVGRTRPPLDRDHGRGLWMANQLCDLVQLRTLATGTVVRLHMRRPPT